MARSTPVIALAGVGILVVAVGAAVLRGTGDDAAEESRADNAGQTDTSSPDPTGSPTDPASSTPDEAPTPTVTATDADDDSVGADDDGVDADDDSVDAADDDAAGGSGDGADEPEADPSATDTDDTDTDDTDDTVAMGPTGTADVQETPNTGGGGLAVLGAGLAAGAVVAGRRPRG